MSVLLLESYQKADSVRSAAEIDEVPSSKIQVHTYLQFNSYS